MRYLSGTRTHGLKYSKTGDSPLGFVDADWGADIDNRFSHTGYTFILAQAAVTWESKKQRTVALSSTEAEYIALTEASKEGVYLRKFLKDVNFRDLTREPTLIFCDNQSAQSLMINPVHHS